MNYAYDIPLGFNDYLLNFFDWDDVTYVRKIPVLKIADKPLKDLIKNKVKINFINQIKNKTVSKLKEKYVAIFFNDKTSIAIIFDNNGVSIKKSHLLFEDEKDILKHNARTPVQKIEYEIIEKEYTSNYTKKEIDRYDYLKEALENTKNNFEKLKYLYYECFNKKEEDPNCIFRTLNHFLNDELVSNKLYEIFNSNVLIDKKN